MEDYTNAEEILIQESRGIYSGYFFIHIRNKDDTLVLILKLS